MKGSNQQYPDDDYEQIRRAAALRGIPIREWIQRAAVKAAHQEVSQWAREELARTPTSTTTAAGNSDEPQP